MHNDWFSSDFHWLHTKILLYDKRPFTDIATHDEFILENLIKTFKPGDNFYFLGDLAWLKKDDVRKVATWMFKLRAFCKVNMFFIKGNHDHKETIQLYQDVGTYLGEQKRIKIGGKSVVLNHFPLRTWNESHYGTYHLYGHHHGDIEHTPWGRSQDVCITLKNYIPFHWDEIDANLSKRIPYILDGDHHELNLKQ